MCGDDDPASGGTTPRQDAAIPFPYTFGLFDIHNHVAERPYCMSDFPEAKTRSQAIMATRSQDQSIVSDLASQFPLTEPEDLLKDKKTVVPGFGQHPWFSHLLYDDRVSEPTFIASSDDTDLEARKTKHYTTILSPPPTDPAFIADLDPPISLTTFLDTMRKHLSLHPHAIVGEIGLDKPFRLPLQWDPAAKADRDPRRTEGGRERRPLSQQKISMDHQKAVLKAQLQLAGEMRRAVSVHGVQVHGVLYEILTGLWKGHEKSKRAKRKAKSKTTETVTKSEPAEEENTEKKGLPYPPRICLHSFSGKSEAVQQYLHPSIPAEIYFSFSATNNLRDGASRQKMEDAVKMVPDEKILVESDLHTVGERMDTELEEVYRVICEVKKWELEKGAKKIRDNYVKFVFG